jgi:hypothetical protein
MLITYVIVNIININITNTATKFNHALSVYMSSVSFFMRTDCLSLYFGITNAESSPAGSSAYLCTRTDVVVS